MCSLSLDVLYDRAIGPFSFIGASFDVCSGAHFPTGSYSYGGSVTFHVIFSPVGALRRLLCRFQAHRCVLFAGMLAISAISPSDIVG
jgi:hypothetical protein